MWSARSEQLDRGHAVKMYIDIKGRSAVFSEVLRSWQEDSAFRSFFIKLLADAPFDAFRWETPPVTRTSVDRHFEFVLLDSPELAVDPDQDAFAEHFKDREAVVSFPNLHRDAVLVAPCPRGPVSAYGHLAAFIREAPEEQKHALWSLVGNVMEQRVGKAPVWLSTAGAGVSWLHVRLDQRPKYYGHAAYRQV